MHCLSLPFVYSQIWGHAAILINKSIWINLPSRVNEALYEFKIYYNYCIPWGHFLPGKILILVPHCSSVYLTFESCTKWCVAANWFIFWKASDMPSNQTNRSSDNSLINTFDGGGGLSLKSVSLMLAYARSPISSDILNGKVEKHSNRENIFLR